MSRQDDKRTKVFTDLYTAISKATAETKNAKGEAQKTIFKGFVKDLFENAPTLTVTKFLWAVSHGHKGLALKTPLFRVTYHGKQGYEIERLHSGFVSNETGKKVTGVDLVPHIIEAANLYKTNPRKQKPIEAPVVDTPAIVPVVKDAKLILPEYAQPLVRPDQLTDEELHTYIDELQATLSAFVAELDKRAFIKAKKAELLKVFSEMAKDEGFDLEDIIGIV